MSQINDIVIKAKNGDVGSMESILQYFKPKVTAICREYFLIGADFDDILQEGMIGLYKAITVYNAERNDNFSNFAKMCIHHQIQNAVKVAVSKKNHPLNDYISINIEGGILATEESPKIILQATDVSAEQLSLSRESANDLYDKVKSSLTEVQYNILLMYLNGYTYNEIAQCHNITSKNVDNNIQSIKRKLREVLKGKQL